MQFYINIYVHALGLLDTIDRHQIGSRKSTLQNDGHSNSRTRARSRIDLFNVLSFDERNSHRTR